MEPFHLSPNPSMRWRTLWFPWIGLALPMVLLLKLLAVVVGSPQGEGSGVLLSTLAFTIHDHGPMALLGVLVAAMALQAHAGSLSGKAMAATGRLTWQLTGVLAVLLSVLFVGSTILGEVELRQSLSQQQVAMEQEAMRLQEELEQIRSAAFLDALAEPGRLENTRAGLPDLPPDADATATAAALEQMVLQDLNDLQQQAQQSPFSPGTRDVWGARLFRQVPEVVLAVGAAVVAAVAWAGLAGPDNKKTTTKDHQPTE